MARPADAGGAPRGAATLVEIFQVQAASNNDEPEGHVRPPSLPPPDPLIGRTVDGRYSIEAVLGEGGMGLVYRARHVVLEKPLAIKVLRAEVSRDQEVMQRFRQEAQSASAIGNHHIIEISDFGVLPDSSTYFVMEFLNGMSLTTAIELSSPMPAERVVRVARQLCEALGAAHDQRIVHRDLKPDNIYLIERGGDPDFVKVLDFGIAKVGGSTSKLTRVGDIFGTPHYMSPEHCAGSAVDQRTDIYALGVILYEMSSGRVPFDAHNVMGIVTQHLHAEPTPLHDLPALADVPAGLEAIIMRCLAKSVDARYQTMHELKEDLERLMAGGSLGTLGGATQPVGTSRSFRTGWMSAPGFAADALAHEPPARRSRAPAFAGIAVAALVAIGLGGYFARGASGETTAAAAAAGHPAVTATPVGGAPSVVEPSVVEPPVAATRPPEEVPPAVASVRLESSPPGAEVLLDGAVLGQTPLAVPRPAGTDVRSFTLRHSGYDDAHVAVTSVAGDSVAIRLERRRTGNAPSASAGASGAAAARSGGRAGGSSGGEPAASSGSSAGGSSRRDGRFTTGDTVIDPWGSE